MPPAIQVILSGCLTFGVPLAVAVHELIALRRPPRGGWSPRPAPEPAPPPTPLGSAPALRPLPACLIPAVMPRRERAAATSKISEPA